MQDNTSAQGLDQAALQWLTVHVMSTLRTAGIKHLAWVCAPTLASYQLAEKVVSLLPQLNITIFYDLEHAATWVQNQLSVLRNRPPRPVTAAKHLLLPSVLGAGYWLRYVA